MLMYDRYSNLAASISIHMYQGYNNALLIWVLQKATGSVRDGSDLVFIVIDVLVTWYWFFCLLGWLLANFVHFLLGSSVAYDCQGSLGSQLSLGFFLLVVMLP